MEEHKNSEKTNWDEHGLVKYSDLINQLLEGSTNSRNLPEEEKKWITFALHQDHSIPFYKADRFVGGAQITPFNRIKQYLLEVQGRQGLVEYNEYEIDKKDLETIKSLNHNDIKILTPGGEINTISKSGMSGASCKAKAISLPSWDNTVGYAIDSNGNCEVYGQMTSAHGIPAGWGYVSGEVTIEGTSGDSGISCYVKGGTIFFNVVDLLPFPYIW